MKAANKKTQYHHNSTGQVIIEALIALGLLTTGVVSILVLINSSLRTLSYAPNQYLAANLAAEGIEIVRNIIDSNIKSGETWNKYIGVGQYEVDYNTMPPTSPIESYDPNHYLNIDSDGLISYSNGDQTPFRREIIISDGPQGDGLQSSITIQSIVLWQERGIPVDVKLEDWYYRPVIMEDNLSSLAKTYNEFTQALDKKILTHNVDEVLRLHDELLIKLFNKQITESEAIEAIKSLTDKLAEVSYSPPNHLENWQGKKLLPTVNKAYFGNWHLRSFLLSKDYSGADKAFAEVFGSSNKFLVSYIDIPIQDNTGRFQNMDELILWSKVIMPPPTLMIKSRLRMGAIPMIQLHLYDVNVEEWFKEWGLSINEKAQVGVADVVNGDLNSYLERQISILNAISYPIVVLFINEFNLDAGKFFGQSGKEFFFDVSQAYGEQALYNQYGDESIPDGPERVRDAWIRLKKIMDKTGASSYISLASHAGAGHQNKAFPNPSSNADWNQMKYYWPGEGVLDYIGMSAYGYVLNKNKDDKSLYGSAYYWWDEIKNSDWKNTPTFFNEFAPSVNQDFPGGKDPSYMPRYIKYNLGYVVPNDFPVSFVLFITPPFPMDENAEINAFEEAVIKNNFYANSVKVE